jgi:hypothetical protein
MSVSAFALLILISGCGFFLAVVLFMPWDLSR